MFRVSLITLFFAMAALSPPAAHAQSVEQSVVSQLREQGYRDITVARTLLGRVRIKGVSGSGRREIVVNPRNGVILRDYLYLFDSGDGDIGSLLGSAREGNSGPGSQNSGSGSDDDDDDDDDHDDHDDDDDDDDDDDNSGSGSGDDDDNDDDDDDDDADT